ncbi:MAG: arginine--tRNA ligase [Bacteroidota bacterium]|nr:arginine--tRNA ligase [Bacteroidota bacterium]
MDINQSLKNATVEAFKEIFDAEIKENVIQIEETNPDFAGDLTIVIFPLLRYSRRSPEETANKVGDFIKEKLTEVESFDVVKGFLNLIIADVYWIKFLKNFDKNSIINKTTEPKKILVEYSSPNTNKPLHLGHIRNNLIGQSISKIMDVSGHKVIQANLINDRGIHICKSMYAWMKYGKNETPESTNTKGDHLIGKYYVLFETKYKEEVEKLKEKGFLKDEAEQQAESIKGAKKLLQEWERGDDKVIKVWKKLNNWTCEGFEKTYKRMGISFDKIYLESDTYLKGKEIVIEGLDKKLFFRKKDASVWCDLKDKGLDEKLLLRSDGTSVYITQDIGTAQIKYDDYKADKSVYIVGNEQIYHFDVLKLILQKLDMPYADTIFHLPYGMVDLPEGKMKSREGKVVDADDLMDEMTETAKNYIIDSGKVDDLAVDEIKKLSELIGLGALKFFILKTDIKKNITFNPKESIDFQGHTGPFVQYSYARIKSILRKAKISDSEKPDFNENVSLQEIEKSLLRKVHNLNKSISDAEKEFDPSVIANYVFQLAKMYNKFYHEIHILKEKDEELKNFRIQLSIAVSEVIKKMMSLLGIDVPEKM